MGYLQVLNQEERSEEFEKVQTENGVSKGRGREKCLQEVITSSGVRAYIS